MLSISEYQRVAGDRCRRDAYAAALERIVGESSIVLQVDAGMGMATLVACQLGARRCYAVEPTSLLQVLKDLCRENGFADRVVAVQGSPAAIDVPVAADVILSDVPGILPLVGNHLSNLLQARHRCLSPNGRVVPERDAFWLSVVSAPQSFAERRRQWQSSDQTVALQSLRPLIDNQCYEHRAAPGDLLCAPHEWARIDYATFTQLGIRGSSSLSVSKAGTAHGLLAWYERALGAGIGYSNGPGAREGDYGQMLFPWPEAVHLSAGDVVEVELRGDPVGTEYVWTWTSHVRRPDHSLIARFRQSTFLSRPLSPEFLRKRAETFVPSLSVAGELVRDLLNAIRTDTTVMTLAEKLVAAHPAIFRSGDEAHGFVASVSERYSV